MLSVDFGKWGVSARNLRKQRSSNIGTIGTKFLFVTSSIFT